MTSVKAPSTLDPTGKLDNTAELSNFLNSLGPGTTVDFPDTATYRVNRSIDVIDQWGLTLKGHGTRFTTDLPPPPGEAAMLTFTGGGDLIVDHLDIKGANRPGGRDGPYEIPREGQHAMQLRGVAGACVSRCEFSNVYGDLIYLGSRKVGPSGTPTGRLWSKDVWLYNLDLHHSGRQGITFQGVRDSVFTRSEIWELRRSTFELEPLTLAYNGADNITISEVTIGRGRLNVIANHGSGPVNNITMRDCVLSRAMNVTVFDHDGARRSGWRILNNRSVLTTQQAQDTGNPQGNVMNFTNVDGVEVKGNIQPIQAGRNMALVQTSGCKRVEVSGNTIFEVDRFGKIGSKRPEHRVVS